MKQTHNKVKESRKMLPNYFPFNLINEARVRILSLTRTRINRERNNLWILEFLLLYVFGWINITFSTFLKQKNILFWNLSDSKQYFPLKSLNLRKLNDFVIELYDTEKYLTEQTYYEINFGATATGQTET